MKCPKTLALACLLLMPLKSNAQNHILLQEKANERYQIPSFGPHRQRFAWIQLSLFGTDIPTPLQDTKADVSHYYAIDFFHKFKINKIASHGYSGGAHRQVFRLSPQGLDKLSPLPWDKGKLVLWGIHAQYFWRFNFDPARGNTTGFFVDLAALVQFNFFQKQAFKIEQTHEKIWGGLIAERYSIAPEIRIGREAFSLYFRYKALSKACRKSENPITQMMLPRFSLGVQLSLFSP